MDKLEIDCKSCYTGDCCRDGVDVDIEEAKLIFRLKLKIRKPWFEDFFPDKSSPSGWVVGTVVRQNRCVFQDENKRCSIYNVRPRYCREFPFEKDKIAPFYKQLCNRGKIIKIKKKGRKEWNGLQRT